jgi:transposase
MSIHPTRRGPGRPRDLVKLEAVMEAAYAMELQLEELAAAAGEDDAKSESVRVQGFTRFKGTRRNFPNHLLRRRVVHPAQTSCPCCGRTKLSKIGEDITETLDVVPRQ